MAIYLKEFETQAAYEAAESGLILPNVSLITETNVVAYKPVDPYMGHDYVEINGLKWATMNIGASSVTDYGLYFQWGDISGYTNSEITSSAKTLDWANYKYWTADTGSGSSGFTKYTGSDGKIALDEEDDAAKANWGGVWRMPTKAEYAALGNAVNAVWTTNYQNSGVNGFVCTDKTDNSKVLFFPACGWGWNNLIQSLSYNGYYQVSTMYDTRYPSYTQNMVLSSNGSIYWDNYGTREKGYSVRPVAE